MEDVPFLLHPASQAFLDGDAHGIQERFAIRRDALDYLASAAVVVGVLVIALALARYASWLPAESAETAVSTLLVGIALILAGGYFVNGRQSWAAARARLIREGQVLPGTLVSCTARDALETGFGEVTRCFFVAVEYRFTTPAGEERLEQAEEDRPDLRRAELPAPGAPVRVLYLDEQTFALL